MSKVRLPLRLRAAWHELSCWECRGTWGAWLYRLPGVRPDVAAATDAPIEGGEDSSAPGDDTTPASSEAPRGDAL